MPAKSRPRRVGPRGPAPRIAGVADDRQRAVFAALAEAKRAGQEVEAARYAIARRFVLTILKVEAIEKVGFDHGWPLVPKPGPPGWVSG